MRLASLLVDGRPVLAACRDGVQVALSEVDPGLGADVGALLTRAPTGPRAPPPPCPRRL